MTDYKVTLKSNIQSVELNKKKVKINCYNNKSGNLVITTLNQNTSIFNGHSYDINKGLDGAKDFNVKFDDKGHAEEFKNAIQAILNDASIVTENPEDSGLDNLRDKVGDILNRATDVFLGPAPAGDAPAGNAPAGDAPAGGGNGGGGNDDSGNKTMLYVGIGGAVLLVLVLVLVLWKKK